MKNTILAFALCTLVFSCQNKDKNNSTGSGDSSATTTTPSTETKTIDTAGKSAAFDLDKIPVSDKALGKFPYLVPPANYKYGMGDDGIKPSDIRDPDREYFAVQGKLRMEEGKTFKKSIEKDRSKDDSRFNSLTVEKSYADQIIALGGVEVNTIVVPGDELKRIGNSELIDKHYGYSIDSNILEHMKTYVIKTKDKVVWIQFTLMNEESGKITVLERPI